MEDAEHIQVDADPVSFDDSVDDGDESDGDLDKAIEYASKNIDDEVTTITTPKVHVVSDDQMKLLNSLLTVGITNPSQLNLKGNKSRNKRKAETNEVEPAVKKMLISVDEAFNQTHWLYKNPKQSFSDIPQNKLSISVWDDTYDAEAFWEALLKFYEGIEENKFKLGFSREGFKLFLMYCSKTFRSGVLKISNQATKGKLKNSKVERVDKNGNVIKDKPSILFSEITNKPFKSDYKVSNEIQLVMNQIYKNGITIPSTPLDILFKISPSYQDMAQQIESEDKDGHKVYCIGKHEYIFITYGFALNISKNSIKCLSQSVNRVMERDISSKVTNQFKSGDWVIIEVSVAQKMYFIDVVDGNFTIGDDTLTCENKVLKINDKILTYEERRQWFHNKFNICDLISLNENDSSILCIYKYDAHTKSHYLPIKRIGVLVGFTQSKLLVGYNTPNGLSQITPVDSKTLFTLKESMREIQTFDDGENPKNIYIDVDGLKMEILCNLSHYIYFKEGVKVVIVDNKIEDYAPKDAEINNVSTKPAKEKDIPIEDVLSKIEPADVMRLISKHYKMDDDKLEEFKKLINQ